VQVIVIVVALEIMGKYRQIPAIQEHIAIWIDVLMVSIICFNLSPP
jgi:hypothetical protein